MAYLYPNSRMRIDPFNAPLEAWLQKWFGWLLLSALVVNTGALWITILEPDGALYASIAKSIARTGDFIDLRAEGRDWLDKPHFPFWMAALSMRIFGINGFAYKLPALLFWAAGGYYTYRLALALCGRVVAQLAVLIYVSAAHLVISNNDVRAEPYLTGLVIGSVYYFYRASRAFAGKEGSSVVPGGGSLVAGSLLAACAVMTKGPFVLVTIGSGFVVDWILSKDWRQFFRLQWWIALALIAIFILPELYCLYVQFDLHPEKTIFGRTGVSGIRWFFWDSQFGRFFNTGPIRGSGDPLFYFHTLLWAFLPWSLLLYAAIFERCRNWKRYRMQAIAGDAIPLGAALISFIMFSVSRFQLPHYLNILFPFFAILTAAWIYGLYKRVSWRIVATVQHVVALLLGVLLLGLCYWFHFQNYGMILAGLVILAALAFLLFSRDRRNEREGAGNMGKDGGAGDRAAHILLASMGRSFCMAMIAYAFINFCFYPALLRYQAGSEAARYMKEAGVQEGTALKDRAGIPGPGMRGSAYIGSIYMLREAPMDYSFEFYCSTPIKWTEIDSLRYEPALQKGSGEGMLLFLPASFRDSLLRRGYVVEELKRFPNFHISQLTAEFLDYRTRDASLGAWLLVRAH